MKEPVTEETVAEEPNEPAQIYTIRFDGGGADGEMESVQISGGSEYAMPGVGYTIEGCTFDCW